MVFNIRNLFLSESQKQVESEVRNIGLAHTIRDVITGSNHEVHVDSYQKKQAVKALQKAKPAQVNELITILKAMPDPTVVEFKTVHSREPSRQHDGAPDPGKGSTSPAESDEQGVDTTSNEPVKAPSSWWAVSFASLMSGFASAPPTDPDLDASLATTTTTTTTTTIRTVAEPNEKDALKEEIKTSDGSDTTTTTTTTTEKTNEKGTLTKTVTTSKTVTTTSPDKTTLVETINSIKKQLAALSKVPPTYMISAYTYWWGYEIYVPHKCMNKLQRVTNTSQIFFGFLSGAVTGIPGLAALVPLSRIISAWVGFQWAVIKAEDLGKGVVLSATWVLPVALAPRAWDHPGTEDEPSAPVKSNLKKIKAA